MHVPNRHRESGSVRALCKALRDAFVCDLHLIDQGILCIGRSETA